jgi:hypothetical protein
MVMQKQMDKSGDINRSDGSTQGLYADSPATVTYDLLQFNRDYQASDDIQGQSKIKIGYRAMIPVIVEFRQ